MPTGRLARLLRDQADACRVLGSPFYSDLFALAADDLRRRGPVARVLREYEDSQAPAAVGLRLLGTVHRLVLEGRAPELVPYYPSVGGIADASAAWPALLRLLDEQQDAVRLGLTVPPQTNEVGRSAALIGALLHVASTTGLPVRLVEIGASAGLNLRADHFSYEHVQGYRWGPPDSPVQLAAAWQGSVPDIDAPLRVVGRHGCDLYPLDPTTAEGRLALTSYVWPDDEVRLARLRGALEVAGRVPATVEQCSAGELLAGLQTEPGTVLVVWHSVMWQYLDPAEQAQASSHLDRLGAAATVDAAVALVGFEPRQDPGRHLHFVLSLTQWPGGQTRLLGDAPPHGIPVTWS